MTREDVGRKDVGREDVGREDKLKGRIFPLMSSIDFFSMSVVTMTRLISFKEANI